MQEKETILNFSFVTANDKPVLALQKKRQKSFLSSKLSKRRNIPPSL